MSTPESTPALEAFRLRLRRFVCDVNTCYDEFVSLLDPDFIASLEQAATKLPAPAGETYTSPKHWRGHIRDLHSELCKHFDHGEFRIRDLREFMKARVDLLPFDLETRDGHSGQQNLIWHKAIHDAIDVKPQTWGDGGPLIVYVSRDRWLVVHP